MRDGEPMSFFEDAKRYLDERGWSFRTWDVDGILHGLAHEHADLLRLFKPNTSIEAAQAQSKVISLEADLSDIRGKYRRTKQELVKMYDEIASLKKQLEHQERLVSVLVDAQSQTSVIPSSRGSRGASMSSTQADVEASQLPEPRQR